MGATAERADAADGRRADACRKAGIGAAAGEFLAHRLAEVARAGGIDLVEALGVGGLHQRLELAEDLEPRARAGEMAVRDDALDPPERGVAIGPVDVAQIDARGRARRHHVDDHAARHGADIEAHAARAVGERMQLDDLAGNLLDRAAAVGEVVAGVRRLAGHVDAHEGAALAAGDDAAVRPAGLGIEPRAGAPRLLLDQVARGRRADLLVGGEQRDHQAGRTELLERREHDRVHSKAGLHVAASGPGAAALVAPERALPRLALGIDGVAVAHEQDGRVRAALPDGRADAVAVLVVRDRIGRDAARGQERADARAGGIDAGLVEAAAVGVHQRLDEAEDRGALARDPVQDLAFRLGQRRHDVLRRTKPPGVIARRAARRDRENGRKLRLNLFRGYRPRLLGRRAEPLPGLDRADRFAHAHGQLALGVEMFPATRIVQLDEMGAPPLSEFTPFARELHRHATRNLLGHRQAPWWERYSSWRASGTQATRDNSTYCARNVNNVDK